jgi:hypothetical protein
MAPVDAVAMLSNQGHKHADDVRPTRTQPGRNCAQALLSRIAGKR